MYRVVVSLTLSMVLIGCGDSHPQAGDFERAAELAVDPDLVDGMLSFDAGALAHATRPVVPVGAVTSSEDLAREKGFEDEPPATLGIPFTQHSDEAFCAGSVLSCEVRSVAECLDGAGCVRARGCVGARAECASGMFDRDACARAGCTWAEHCEGEATPCSLLNEDACGVQPGCGYVKP
jgi:hypothetical protein